MVCMIKTKSIESRCMNIILIVITLFFVGCGSVEQGEVVPSNDGTPNIGDEAISMPLGQYVLVRDENENYAAVMLNEMTKTGNGGVTYNWYFQSDKSGKFTNNKSKKGSGEVFEENRKVGLFSIEEKGRRPVNLIK